MAPVLKRRTISLAGSTSSSGTGAPAGEKPMRSRRVTARPGRCTHAEYSLKRP
mgnify:CR=1 FL=1